MQTRYNMYKEKLLSPLAKICFIILCCCVRESVAGYCRQTYSCMKICYVAEKYQTNCGFFDWDSCTEYRRKSKGCSSTCYRNVCCHGYTGQRCDIPRCNPGCRNGGKCISPGVCSCPPGFTNRYCDDIDECKTGQSRCQQLCTNTHGSYTCSCRPGYQLFKDKETCFDINECLTNNGGCQHICSNTDGSYECGCYEGYSLTANNVCTDYDECQFGEANCSHGCINTQGSYHCICAKGFVLSPDEKNCEDEDECVSVGNECEHFCQNTQGSYKCTCQNGFELQTDGKTCQEKDLCAMDNGGCMQLCSSSFGSTQCSCSTGWILESDQRTCSDIDECASSALVCEQTCDNSIGSFTCGCRSGFTLANDSRKCNNIDDCKGVHCENDGTCIDGINDYTCSCIPGFTGKQCQNDFDECSVLNGGCREICTNNIGSYECSCQSGEAVKTDGSCPGTTKPDVFQKYNLLNKLLPRGCSLISILTCPMDNVKIDLSSTSHWYSGNDLHTSYTSGIVFLEVNNLSVPFSIAGAEISRTRDSFSLSYKLTDFGSALNISNNSTKSENCISFEFNQDELLDFREAGSILKTLFAEILNVIPNWMKMKHYNGSIIDMQYLQTNLIYGEGVNNIHDCTGAPLFLNRLYSVYRFDSKFSLSIYSNQIQFPNSLLDKRFCLIIDICQNYGGSVFLMIPKESRDILLQLNIFKTLHHQQNIRILPRGIGFSFADGVHVNTHQTNLQLWNGDRMFQYSLSNTASFWIGGDLIYEPYHIQIKGAVDIFARVPSLNNMLVALYYDEWDAFVRARGTAELNFNITVFGKDHTIGIPLGEAELKAVVSVGGQNQRIWCGDTSNPPGLFITTKLRFNPFQTIPILKDFDFDLSTEVHILITADLRRYTYPLVDIKVINDVLAIQNVINNIKQFLMKVIEESGKLGSTSLCEIQNDLLAKLQSVNATVQQTLTDLRNSRYDNIVNVFPTLWKHVTSFEELTNILSYKLQKYTNNTLLDFQKFLKTEVNNLYNRVSNAIHQLTDHIAESLNYLTGLGLKFRAELRILNLKIVGIDFEMVYSSDALLECSRFYDVHQLFKGQPAIRMLGALSTTVRISRFIKIEGGAGVGMALAMRSFDIVVQLHSHLNIFGITITKDIYLYKRKFNIYIEGNVWGVFFAHLDITADVGETWPLLTVRGSLTAKARRKRQIQTDTNSFENSYLDGMRKILSNIAEGARQRLSQAQHALTVVQNKLTIAQELLEEKKTILRSASAAFEIAIKSLNVAKEKLEKAKGPFQRAIEKLNSAQRKVDNLCRIRKCSKVCIPGIKCRACFKRMWFVRIPWLCCSLTSCMISFPDPLCLLANAACLVVRGIAYVALEAAKVFVRLPMLALDAAKIAVSAAQIITDKSRVVLKVAEGVLDIANFGLDLVKTSLELAKQVLEGLKLVIGVAAAVLDAVIQHGLQNILDVRNCQFTVRLSVVDVYTFDIICDVNAFNTGWRKLEVTINFKNIIQSLWSAAKLTINALLEIIGSAISGRHRRDVTFNSLSRMYILFRKIRNADDVLGATFVELNDTEFAVNETVCLSNSFSNEYEERKLIFDSNCKTVTRHFDFFRNTMESLHEIVSNTKSSFDEADNVRDEINKYQPASTHMHITTENLGINVDYAKHYNIGKDDIDSSLREAETTIRNDPNLLEIQNITEFSEDLLKSEMQSIDIGQYVYAWIASLDNLTLSYFNKSECVGFADCLLFSMSILHDIFSVDIHSNVSEIQRFLNEIEDDILVVLQNSSYNIYGIYNITNTLTQNVHSIIDLNIYCSKPPVLVQQLRNVTTVIGGQATFFCRVTSEPSSKYWWYRDGDLIHGENNSHLTISNITYSHHGYRCIAGNVVANVSSNDAFITISSNKTDLCQINNGGCEHICNNRNGIVNCQCESGFEIEDGLKNCRDKDECKSNVNPCNQRCENTVGSYRCSCFDGFHFDQSTTKCVKDRDICEEQGLNCSKTSGCNRSNIHNPTCFCNDGYQLTNNGTYCEDIDECLSGVCNHKCVNTNGGYLCMCSIGFVLNDDGLCTECEYPYWGRDCNRTCECLASTRCDPVFGCICEKGWRGEKCDEDINECEEMPDICNGTMEECINDDGFYSCVCKEGYTKNDNGTCEDLKECSWNPSPCDQICNEMEGSFICGCTQGYVLGEDMRTCSESDCVSDCRGIVDGNFPSCNTKHGYVTCSNGHMYERPCPADLVWNDRLKICDWEKP